MPAARSGPSDWPETPQYPNMMNDPPGIPDFPSFPEAEDPEPLAALEGTAEDRFSGLA